MRKAVKLAVSGAAFAVLAALPVHAQAPLVEAGMAGAEMPDAGSAIRFGTGRSETGHSEPAAMAWFSGHEAKTSSLAASLYLPAIDLSIEAAAAAADAETLSDADLDANRGGQALIMGSQTLKAITSGNVLTGDYVAGAVTLSDNAFSNFTGLGNIAINTGAQVSLQSGVNVIINVGQ